MWIKQEVDKQKPIMWIEIKVDVLYSYMCEGMCLEYTSIKKYLLMMCVNILCEKKESCDFCNINKFVF